MISPTNSVNPDKHFNHLLTQLAHNNKDFAFFKDKCLAILTRQVDWPVDDLTGYLEDLQPDNILAPKNSLRTARSGYFPRQ